MKNYHCFWVLVTAGMLVNSCASTKELNQKNAESIPSYTISEEELVNRLSESIQYQTVSLEDTTEINYEVYDKFIDFLERSYPNLYGNTERVRIGEYSLLYKWEGSQRFTPLSQLDIQYLSLSPHSGQTRRSSKSSWD